MQNGVEHPVRPLHAPSGQLPNSLEDGVAVAVLFGQDRQDDRGRGSSRQVLVDLHDFPRRAALTNSDPSVHISTIHDRLRYIKRNLTTRFPHTSAPADVCPRTGTLARESKATGHFDGALANGTAALKAAVDRARGRYGLGTISCRSPRCSAVQIPAKPLKSRHPAGIRSWSHRYGVQGVAG